MKIRSLPFSLAAIALATATSFAPLRAEQALDTTAISVAPGRTGKMMPGDVYRVGLPRTDLHVTIDGLVLKPGFAVGGYAVYKAEPQGTLVLGDMVLLPSEVSAVQPSLESSGFTITALHNHLLNEVPHVVYRHYLHAVHGFKADRARRRSAARCLTLL